MNTTQSKLMIQLNKEKRGQTKSKYDQERIDQIFATISKIQPKNLMLVEFLTLIIEKGFIRNSYSLSMFTKMFQQIKQKNTVQNLELAQNNTKSHEGQQNKFHKKKFITLLKQIGKKLYPGQANAYQTVIYDKIAGLEHDDHRLKIDDVVRKILNAETIKTLGQNQAYLQTIFQVYMPENYNYKMGFSWQQIRVLEKKLPIVCVLRFLHQAQVLPQPFSSNIFLQNCSKTIPPLNTNHKQVMFYYPETITNYLKEPILQPNIRLIEGDIGLNFLEFQILFTKLAIEFSKDSKHDYSCDLQKFINHIKIKEVMQDPKQTFQKQTKFIQTVRQYITSDKKPVSKINVKKRQSKQKMEQLFDFNDQLFDSQFKKSQFETVHLTPSDIDSMRRVLDQQLPPLPERQEIDKQNQGFYDLNTKHVVIGQQLPKLQEKNKPAVSKNNKKQKQDQLLGYKPQIQQKKTLSNDQFQNIIKRAKKLRVNNQFPIILSQVLYPSQVPSLNFTPASQIYLQTTYIHLGQRLYEKAFVNFRKAKGLMESKSLQGDIFFQLLEAQIFQSAGKDQAALLYYNKAKEISLNLPSYETYLKSLVYLGLGSCLYHLEEYQFSFRCFLKAQSVRGKDLQVESIQNAILHNNIGCCLMMLNRNNQAMKRFEVSQKIFDYKVGKFDQRTLVVQQNFNKNKKAYIQMLPSFKTMWRTYVQKTNNKPVAKGKVKPKK